MLPHEYPEPPAGSTARPHHLPLGQAVAAALTMQDAARYGHGTYDPIALWQREGKRERAEFARHVKAGYWHPAPGLRGAAAFADVVNHLWWTAGRMTIREIPRRRSNPAAQPGPGPLVPMGSADWILLDDGRRMRFPRGAALYSDEDGTTMYILRPRHRRRTLARVPRGRRARSLDLYRDWYARGARRLLAQKVPRFSLRGRRVGRVHTLAYTKPRSRYAGPKYHPFEGTHPILVALNNGQFAIAGGNFRVTRWGILR